MAQYRPWVALIRINRLGPKKTVTIANHSQKTSFLGFWPNFDCIRINIWLKACFMVHHLFPSNLDFNAWIPVQGITVSVKNKIFHNNNFTRKKSDENWLFYMSIISFFFKQGLRGYSNLRYFSLKTHFK